MNKSLFVVRLGLPKEYELLFERVLETFILFATIHVLMHLAPPESTGLFGQNFWRLIIFATLGFAIYHLVVRKIVSFEFSGESNAATTSLHEILSDFRAWLKSLL